MMAEQTVANKKTGGKKPPRQKAGSSPRRKNERRRPSRSEGGRSEFAQKVIDVRRVARVVQGGRRFSFSVTVALGDKKGSVGVGVGKASDTAFAIEKAVRDAKKNMIKVPLSETGSIVHEVRAKYGSAEVLIIPVPGKGLAAGSSVRAVLDLAGITDVTAKILSRSKNKLNNTRATIKALRQLI